MTLHFRTGVSRPVLAGLATVVMLSLAHAHGPAEWIQRGSIDFYPTAIERQNYQPPLAEFAILHLQLLSGSDRFANLVQWFSFVVSIVLGHFIHDPTSGVLAEAFELTRALNAGCGFACTIHANSAIDALDALVNAALMAGENVTERVVRKVFASSIDLVVHLERDVDADDEGIRRQTMEIRALVPSLHDDFSSEPLFVRKRIGSPLEWTGVLPPDPLIRRLDRALPRGIDLARVLQGEASW